LGKEQRLWRGLLMASLEPHAPAALGHTRLEP
jgi:hypothetical protein